MSYPEFEHHCDRLSALVDDVQFERLRWARHEGPMLARLIELAQGAIERRSDFTLVEEGTSRDQKRFVLKIHSNRVVALVLSLDGDNGVVRAEAIERGRYTVTPGQPVAAPFKSIDAAWMAAAMTEMFARIQPAETAVAA